MPSMLAESEYCKGLGCSNRSKRDFIFRLTPACAQVCSMIMQRILLFCDSSILEYATPIQLMHLDGCIVNPV